MLRSTDRSNSRLRHPVRRLPPPPGRSILRRQARICQFCGAKELAKGHELSLLRRGNLCAARASSQRAARAAAPRPAHPPFSSPSFASARRSFCHANLFVKSATSSFMSKKPALSASGRKEFFGLAAQLDSSGYFLPRKAPRSLRTLCAAAAAVQPQPRLPPLPLLAPWCLPGPYPSP